MSVEIYVDITAITPMITVDTLDPIWLPVACNKF